MAEWSLAALLEGKGDIDGAKAAYQRAIDSNHPDAAPGHCLTSEASWPGTATSTAPWRLTGARPAAAIRKLRPSQR